MIFRKVNDPKIQISIPGGVTTKSSSRHERPWLSIESYVDLGMPQALRTLLKPRCADSWGTCNPVAAKPWRSCLETQDGPLFHGIFPMIFVKSEKTNSSKEGGFDLIQPWFIIIIDRRYLRYRWVGWWLVHGTTIYAVYIGDYHNPWTGKFILKPLV